MKKNKMMICGRNTTTEPTPEITPSVIRSRSRLGGSMLFTPALSQATALSSASAKGVAPANTA